MSEPLTSHEIEDVLSSIRRLVSQDLRPVARAASATAAAAVPVAGGKLLLTPSLRVVSEAPIPVATAKPDATPDATPLAARETEFEAEFEDGFDSESGPVAGSAALRLAVPDDVYDDAGMEPGATAGRAAGPAADPVPEAGWVDVDADWGEDFDDGAAVPFVAHPRTATLADDPLARAWADRAEAEVRAVLQTPPKAAPAAAAPAAVPPEPLADAGDEPVAGAGPGLFDGDQMGLDEEVLREIIRDVLREELAGALGERITRNVRKLVRVEINRALTAREFE